MTLCPLTLLATSQEKDILKFDGSEYQITVFPLEESPTRLNESPLKVNLRTEPNNSMRSSNYRGYVATWEIKDKKLYLVDIDGWIQKYSHTEREYLSDDEEYPKRFRSKVHYTYEKATLELLFPQQVVDEKVFTSWFSGELYTGGYRPAAKLSEEFIENQKSRAELIFQITNGNIDSIMDKRDPNQKLEPTPDGAAHP